MHKGACVWIKEAEGWQGTSMGSVVCNLTYYLIQANIQCIYHIPAQNYPLFLVLMQKPLCCWFCQESLIRSDLSAPTQSDYWPTLLMNLAESNSCEIGGNKKPSCIIQPVFHDFNTHKNLLLDTYMMHYSNIVVTDKLMIPMMTEQWVDNTCFILCPTTMMKGRSNRSRNKHNRNWSTSYKYKHAHMCMCFNLILSWDKITGSQNWLNTNWWCKNKTTNSLLQRLFWKEIIFVNDWEAKRLPYYTEHNTLSILTEWGNWSLVLKVLLWGNTDLNFVRRNKSWRDTTLGYQFVFSKC